MLKHLTNIMEKIKFPEDSQSFFIELYLKLSSEDLVSFGLLKNRYFMYDKTEKTNEEVSDEVQLQLKEIADKYGVSPYSVDMLFLLYCTEELMINYEKKGIALSYFYELMMDLTYKLYECKKLYDTDGVFTFFWFQRHFMMELFSLGRFQFEKNTFNYDTYTFGDITLKRGDTVYTFHIPSSGAMTKEMRYNSYKKAFEFFKEHDEKYIPIACDSWLLYPNNREFYPEGSNLMDFMNDFDILYGYEHESAFPDSWRIFNMDFNGDTSVLPKETTLQKNIVKYLETGRKIGNGYGIILFDGENIINQSN